MTTPPVRVERRSGQRFPYVLSISFRQDADSVEGVAFTQDLSSRGVFFVTDAPLTEGAAIELTLRMPSEITLGESMPVRCRGKILRIMRPASSVESVLASAHAETKIGVAVRLECYEYLPETRNAADVSRVASLHHREDEQTMAHTASRE